MVTSGSQPLGLTLSPPLPFLSFLFSPPLPSPSFFFLPLSLSLFSPLFPLSLPLSLSQFVFAGIELCGLMHTRQVFCHESLLTHLSPSYSCVFCCFRSEVSLSCVGHVVSCCSFSAAIEMAEIVYSRGRVWLCASNMLANTGSQCGQWAGPCPSCPNPCL